MRTGFAVAVGMGVGMLALSACSTAEVSAEPEAEEVVDISGEEPTKEDSGSETESPTVVLEPAVETSVEPGDTVQMTLGHYELAFTSPERVTATQRGTEAAQALLSMHHADFENQQLSITPVYGYFELADQEAEAGYRWRSVDLESFDPAAFLTSLPEVNPHILADEIAATDRVTTFSFVLAEGAPEDVLFENEGKHWAPLVMGARAWSDGDSWFVGTDEVPHVGAFVPLDDAWFLITSADDEGFDGPAAVQQIVDSLQFADGFEPSTVDFAAPVDLHIPQDVDRAVLAGETLTVDLHPQPITLTAAADGNLYSATVSDFRASGENEDVPMIWLSHVDRDSWMRLSTLEGRVDTSADTWQIRAIHDPLNEWVIPSNLQAFELGEVEGLQLEGAEYAFTFTATAKSSSVFTRHDVTPAIFSNASLRSKDWDLYLDHEPGETLVYYVVRFGDVDYLLLAETDDRDLADELARSLRPFEGDFDQLESDNDETGQTSSRND